MQKEDDCHILVGECFVWGLMDGEAIERRTADEYKMLRLVEIYHLFSASTAVSKSVILLMAVLGLNEILWILRILRTL
jgi:hypothetical protein